MLQGPRRPTKAALSKIPLSRFRLARGCAPPSGGLRPVRRGALPSSGLRLAQGPAAPRAGSASLEGPSRPRPGSATLEGAPHACAGPVRGHLRPDTGGTAPSCVRGSRPGAAAPTPQEEAHPHHCGEGLYGRTGASPVMPRRLLRYG
jgi:hypothetical protein